MLCLTILLKGMKQDLSCHSAGLKMLNITFLMNIILMGMQTTRAVGNTLNANNSVVKRMRALIPCAILGVGNACGWIQI